MLKILGERLIIHLRWDNIVIPPDTNSNNNIHTTVKNHSEKWVNIYSKKKKTTTGN